MSNFFAPDNKRRKILDELDLNGPVEEEFDDSPDPMSYDELMDVKYTKCFACDNLHVKAIENNENYAYMMKLYTENSSAICKDAIYKNIHTYFHQNIVPDLLEVKKIMEEQGQTENIPDTEWSLACIKEHFESHTNFPTDEILFQIRLKKALRNKLSNNLVNKNKDGTLTFNHKNIDIYMKLEKGIVELMRQKKDINTMVGFSPELNY